MTMCFALVHLGDVPSPAEEAYVFVPGTTKTVIAVPLDELPAFVPLLAQALDASPTQHCPACDARLPACVFGVDESADDEGPS